MSVLSCQYHRGGVFLPALGLWLDPHQPRVGPERVFVSHAHADHVARHREIIVSPPTARLMAARLPGERVEHVLAWGAMRAFTGGPVPWQITLFPAGHILGSAMALIEAGGETLLYTGDFKLRTGRSAEPCEPVRADLLIMETTFGRPEYVFPPTEEILPAIVRFCAEALAEEETPVLLGYSLGKSQELLRLLEDVGLPLALHPEIARMSRIYEELGQHFPSHVVAEGQALDARVLVWPPGAGLGELARAGRPLRKAILTGWAVDPGCRYRYGVQAAFPLSDHSDFPELLEFVHRVGPRRVFTLHGFAADFAATLRGRGIEAWALGEDEQLTLNLRVEELQAPSTVPVRVPCPAPSETGNGSFGRFASVCEEIRQRSARRDKVALLAGFLSELSSDSMGCVVRWLAGWAGPGRDSDLPLVGWAAVREATCEVAGVATAALRTAYLKHCDTAQTVREVFLKQGRPSACPSVERVIDGMAGIAAAPGGAARKSRLAGLLSVCGPDEARALVRILTGELRMGHKAGLVEEALALAFGEPPEAVRRAVMRVGDIGEVARLVRRGELALATLRPFRPVNLRLATTALTSEAAWERVMGWRAESPEGGSGTPEGNPIRVGTSVGSEGGDEEETAWVEPRYDGVRCQLHRVGARVALFSRELKEITDAYEELAEAARRLPMEVILDGELVVMRGDRPLPLSEWQWRLGRRDGDLFAGGELPVRLMVFDALWCDGIVLIDRPFWERRQWLERMGGVDSRVVVAKVERVGSATQLEACYQAARARGYEGLMIKSPRSVYHSGCRGLDWIKLKPAVATREVAAAAMGMGETRRANRR